MFEFTWDFSVGLDSLSIDGNEMEFNYFISMESLPKNNLWFRWDINSYAQITNDRELTGSHRNKESEESHSEVQPGIKLRHFAAVVTS